MGKAMTTDAVEGALGIMAKGKKKAVSHAAKAGLCFPVSKVNRHLRTADTRGTKRVGAGAPIYLAAVLEYAAGELIELSGNALGKRKRITAADIMTCIRKDEELNRLFGRQAIFVGDRVKGISDAVTIKNPQFKGD